MKENKGFTLVELLISFTLLTIVLIYLVKATTNIMVRENEVLMLQEYNVFESTLLNNIYDDTEGLTDLKIEENNGELNIRVGNSVSIYKNISFVNNKDEKGIYYDNVLYELPENVEFNSSKYYTIKNGTYTEDNYIKNYSIISIYLIVNNKDKKINIIFQNGKPRPESKVICKRATKLHTEECTQTDTTYSCSGAGYTTSGSKKTSTITYGNLGTKGTLSSGDAFDCDVNGDGTYDENTERFYYVTDMDDNTAVLIYYNNVSAGSPSNSAIYAYDSSEENFHGPRTAIEQLPTISQWKNVSLKNSTRAILNENAGNTTTGGILPSNFSYSGYAARLLTMNDIRKTTNNGNIPTKQVGELDDFNYLLENTKYSNPDVGNYGYWLETPYFDNSTDAWSLSGDSSHIYYTIVSNEVYRGVRPAIEVLKSDISY